MLLSNENESISETYTDMVESQDKFTDWKMPVKKSIYRTIPHVYNSGMCKLNYSCRNRSVVAWWQAASRVESADYKTASGNLGERWLGSLSWLWCWFHECILCEHLFKYILYMHAVYIDYMLIKLQANMRNEAKVVHRETFTALYAYVRKDHI